MSLLLPDFSESVIVRSTDAEVVGAAPTTVRLLADSSSTGGALSTQRVTLVNGADGARPHRHDNSAEMFYMLGPPSSSPATTSSPPGPGTSSSSRRGSRTPSRRSRGATRTSSSSSPRASNASSTSGT